MRIQDSTIDNSVSDDNIQDVLINPNDTASAISDEQDKLEDSILHHTWFVRTFGPMKKGSLRQSVIALMCTAMGSGMLAFSSNARQSGLGNAMILMVVCALLSRFSMHLLMECAFKHDTKTYSDLVTFALGRKIKRAYEIDVIFYTFGAIVCYQILFTQLVMQVYHQFYESIEYDDYVGYGLGLAFMVINFPVSMMRDIYSLRYFTHLQILVILYIMVAIITYFGVTLDQFDASKILWFKFDINIFSTFASTFFGFICHQLIFPIRSELKRASFKRMGKIFNRAIASETLIYMAFLVFGYLTWFGETANIIIDNYSNIYFTVSKALFAFILFFAVPINLNPSRVTIMEVLGKTESKPAYVVITVVLQITSGALAMILPQVKSVFGLLGGFLGMNMVIVMPGLIYLTLSERKLTSPDNLATMIICILAGGAGFTGAVVSQFQQ